MAIKELNELKARFEAGDIPSGQDFVDLIDTLADLNAFWPAVLPAADAGNLTNLPLPNPLPALSGELLYNLGVDEYQDLAQHNPSYADATSFTLAGDHVDLFKKTRRLRLQVDGDYLYTTPQNATYDAQADATVVTITDPMPSNLLEAVGVSIFTPFIYGGAVTPEMIGVTQNYNPAPTDPPSMAVSIGVGRTFDGVTFTLTAQANTPAFVAPAVDPRIDRIAVNRRTGAIEIIEGSENANPTAPAYSGHHYPIGRIALSVGMTEITAEEITPEFADTSYALRSESGILAKPLPLPDTNHTLSADEYACQFLKIDTANLTTTRNVSVPAGVQSRIYFVLSPNTNAHNINFGVLGGNHETIYPGQSRIIITDGVDAFDATPITPDRLPNAASTTKGAIKARLSGTDLYITFNGNDA